jgi:SOS-response transcriptional repressor LexA
LGNIDIQIGERLKIARINLGFDKAVAFSGKLGLENQTYGRYEKGDRSLPDEIKLQLFEMGINISWLVTGEGEMFIKSAGSDVATVGHQIPLLRQKVSCGPGQHWEDETNIDRYVNVFDLVPRLKTGRVYAIPVNGSSMLGAGIKDGDIVLFEANKEQDTHDGIYVFSLDGDVYCKRLEFDALTQQIKVFSVRVADLEKAELAMSFKVDDSSLSDRLQIFGRVFAWFHPENWGE